LITTAEFGESALADDLAGTTTTAKTDNTRATPHTRAIFFTMFFLSSFLPFGV
jgi:hypothetical protein